MNILHHFNIIDFYFKLMWGLTLVLYIAIPLKSSFLNTIYLSIIGITLVSFFFSVVYYLLKRKVESIIRVDLILFFLIVALVAVSIFFGKRQVGKDEAKLILGYFEMFMSILILHLLSHNEENMKYLFRINILISVVFIILSLSKYAYSGVIRTSLYLGYSNPNQTGIFLFLNMTILLIMSIRLKKPFLRFLVYLICAYEFYLIVLTGSRSCVFTSVVLIVVFLLKISVRIHRWIIITSMLLPLAFLFGYSYLYSSGMLVDAQLLGKSIFTGREEFFISKISSISEYLLIGDATEYYFANLHNGPLTIILSCGIVGYVLYLCFYYNTIKCYYSDNDKVKTLALVAILAVFIHSSSECAMITGGAQYSIVTSSVYWLLKGGIYSDE